MDPDLVPAPRLRLLAQAAALAEHNGLLHPLHVWRLQTLSRGMRAALQQAGVEADLLRHAAGVAPRGRHNVQQEVIFRQPAWLTGAIDPSAPVRPPPVGWVVRGMAVHLGDEGWDALLSVRGLQETLQRLWVRHALSSDLAAPCAAFGALRELRVLDAPALRDDLRAVGQLRTLETLYVGDCANLRSVAGLEGCEALRSVQLVQLDALCDLSALGRLPALQDLGLACIGAVESLAPLATCPALEELAVVGCERVARADFCRPGAAPPLRRLLLAFLPALADLAPLVELRGLRQLELKSLGVTGLRGLRGARFELVLERLVLRFLDGLASLDGIEGCRALRDADLGFCPALVDVSALADARRLRSLNLRGCRSVIQAPEALLRCETLEQVVLDPMCRAPGLMAIAEAAASRKTDTSL